MLVHIQTVDGKSEYHINPDMVAAVVIGEKVAGIYLAHKKLPILELSPDDATKFVREHSGKPKH